MNVAPGKQEALSLEIRNAFPWDACEFKLLTDELPTSIRFTLLMINIARYRGGNGHSCSSLIPSNEIINVPFVSEQLMLNLSYDKQVRTEIVEHLNGILIS